LPYLPPLQGYNRWAGELPRLKPGLSSQGPSGRHADNADSADSADSADNADSADSADSADNADSADSADSADNAGNAQRPTANGHSWFNDSENRSRLSRKRNDGRESSFE
jgi:hypothetical protein